MYTYKPYNVCSKEISFDIINNTFLGHKCWRRNTSYMDKFAHFILESLKKGV